jgi:hypothetical protein
MNPVGASLLAIWRPGHLAMSADQKHRQQAGSYSLLRDSAASGRRGISYQTIRMSLILWVMTFSVGAPPGPPDLEQSARSGVIHNL